MSGNATDPYAEITADVPGNARRLWEQVRTDATKIAANVRGEVRGGVAGYLWDGALVNQMELIWPQLAHQRSSREANAVRRELHKYLTRQGLLHCDARGGGPMAPGRKPRWWVSAEFDPQPGGWRKRFVADDDIDAEAEENRMEEALETESEPETQTAAETELEASSPTDGRSFAEVVAQVWEVVQAATRAGTPLTATALAQIPTGVSGTVRRDALRELEGSGVVWSEAWIFGGRQVTVYLCDVNLTMPAVRIPNTGQREAADVVEEFLADYRRKEAEAREMQEKLHAAQVRLEAINTALGR